MASCRVPVVRKRHKRDTCFALAHANWSGVKKDVLCVDKKFEHHGLREIVIIKYSNISTEVHVYINKMSFKQKNRPL